MTLVGIDMMDVTEDLNENLMLSLQSPLKRTSPLAHITWD